MFCENKTCFTYSFSWFSTAKTTVSGLGFGGFPKEKLGFLKEQFRFLQEKLGSPKEKLRCLK